MFWWYLDPIIHSFESNIMPLKSLILFFGQLGKNICLRTYSGNLIGQILVTVLNLTTSFFGAQNMNPFKDIFK